MKVYSALKDGGYLVTDGKVFAPGQNPAVAVNAEFPWRSTLTALGLHQELVCGIGCYKDAQLGMHVAASVVSCERQGPPFRTRCRAACRTAQSLHLPPRAPSPPAAGGYENRDLGGVLEAALGQDSLVLSGTGRGDQEFENPGITGMDRNLSMANSMDQGTLLRVMRKAEAGGGYVYCGVYKVLACALRPAPRPAALLLWTSPRGPPPAQIVDRWKALVDVGEGGGARRRVRCCFKLARESEQPALKVVQVRQPDEERRSQLEVSQKLLLQDPEEGSHEFCSCCAMDLDGRVGFECDWYADEESPRGSGVARFQSQQVQVLTGPHLPACRCQKRLEGGATPPECTPALCQRPGRTGCVHTWPGMLCSECVEAKVLPLVEADGEANRFQWCCALCAARHGMWGGQLPTGRGVWVRDGRALYGAALEAAAGVPQTQEAAGSPGASGSAPALPHTPPIGPAPAGAKRRCGAAEAAVAPKHFFFC
jgi:hypothetical protein